MTAIAHAKTENKRMHKQILIDSNTTDQHAEHYEVGAWGIHSKFLVSLDEEEYYGPSSQATESELWNKIHLLIRGSLLGHGSASLTPGPEGDGIEYTNKVGEMCRNESTDRAVANLIQERFGYQYWNEYTDSTYLHHFNWSS